jgi:hypothetical protein
MKEWLLWLSFLLLAALLAMIGAGVQTAFWPALLGTFPPPALWVLPLVFVSLYRPSAYLILFAYTTAFAVSPLTTAGFAPLVLASLMMAFVVQSFKLRVYWSSSTYAMLVGSLGGLLINVFLWTITALGPGGQPRMPEIFDWLIQALLTALFAPIAFVLMRWLERVARQETVIEMTAEVD